ncbi:SMP-30/Gluconolaconase/LRE-like region-containing protein [Nitrosomonas sp. Nm51]|uniref:SMP-30/gluconolactonase/LRE family protein n=1 Tax=Nitrosomonas sp. Nm51 TaxID=133720 RepID=UPI0008BCCE9C|nr:SMP-30/gluconolactonase/LRE family protein [Nitrosomonas sp. Nm51]SER54749.1 SMP-30/Gluconolaconase/LRE-like region-containing protein [Nitrosomonas sp. Nm51]
MKKWLIILLAVAGVTWWLTAAPRNEIGCCIADSVTFDAATTELTDAVDQSSAFAAGIEEIVLDLPAYDDAVFLDDGKTIYVTAHDGKIWRVDLAAHIAEPLVDAPLMAWGIHEAPDDPAVIYFCSSGAYEDRPAGEAVGLYRLDLDTRVVKPLVLNVPQTSRAMQRPIVYADHDTRAPELRFNEKNDLAVRKLIVCDNLEVSEDGRRIYFSEPFDYENSSTDDAIDEAIALAPNGRLWLYDLDSHSVRLVAEGFHFINGVLIDPHPGRIREQSVIVTQTSQFRVARFFLNGPKAGTSEIVIDSLPGMPDGMDRDAHGRIWLAMFTDRSPLLTWVHENAWIKPVIMRLPVSLLLTQTQRTGVVVLSPDGGTPLYSAFYEGPELASIASAVPAPSGIYLANVKLDGDRNAVRGIQRLAWPEALAN